MLSILCMGKADKMTSKCKQCGEQILKTGNYTMKILPAKRIPKKSKKIMRVENSLREQEQSGSWKMTKFHKFLFKRAKPVNCMELTCGKCGGVSQIKMHKNLGGANERSVSVSSEITNRVESGPSSNIQKPTKKRQKDKSAGLTLPSTSGTLTKGHSPKAVQSANKPISKLKRQKELDNLNKMLFSSKKAKKSGSTLQDFLSGI